MLFYLKECSQSEIAAFLRVSVGSVNDRLHQARQRLKKWENQMHTSRLETQATEPERASRVGSVVAVDGPLVHARFEPHAPLDLLDALVMLNADGSQVERMKVCQRLDNGLALCLVTRGDEPIQLGASVLNTCRVGLASRDGELTRRVAEQPLARGARGLPMFVDDPRQRLRKESTVCCQDYQRNAP